MPMKVCLRWSGQSKVIISAIVNPPLNEALIINTLRLPDQYLIFPVHNFPVLL